MENAEEIFHFLEEFSKRKPKTIPQELNDYLAYVARTGDPVYQWSLVKSLFKEKLLNVITDFYETTPGIDIPPYPNVDTFNYDIMKNSLLERLDSFTSAPFTVQRICELLTCPRKQYNRIDKFMRAIEKNILVVSTREPGVQRHAEPENGEPAEPIVNGSDNNSEYNVDVEMEDMSWKDNNEQRPSSEPQPGSSDAHISVDDIEARLQAKEDAPMDTQEKTIIQYESVTPPELNVTADEEVSDIKPNEGTTEAITTTDENKPKTADLSATNDKLNLDVEKKSEVVSNPALVIPVIKVDNAEITEQRLREQFSETFEKSEETNVSGEESSNSEGETATKNEHLSKDENNLDSNTKDESESKHISEVSTSSEESSSSSDNTDGNSNSPKTDAEIHIDIQEESNQSDTNSEEISTKQSEEATEHTAAPTIDADSPKDVIQTDNYSISDVKSELPQPSNEAHSKTQDVISETKEDKDAISNEAEKNKEETKADNPELNTENTKS